MNEDIKCFNALVVDRTEAGILGNLPRFQRETALRTCTDDLRMQQRLMCSAKDVKALKNLLTKCKATKNWKRSKTDEGYRKHLRI